MFERSTVDMPFHPGDTVIYTPPAGREPGRTPRSGKIVELNDVDGRRRATVAFEGSTESLNVAYLTLAKQDA